MKDIPVNERIILALDVDSPEQAKELVKKTESHINFYKVGLQLFMASWFEIVDWMIDLGVDTFIEVGPKTVLAGLIKKCDTKGPVTTMNVQDRASLEQTLAALG